MGSNRKEDAFRNTYPFYVITAVPHNINFSIKEHIFVEIKLKFNAPIKMLFISFLVSKNALRKLLRISYLDFTFPVRLFLPEIIKECM